MEPFSRVANGVLSRRWGLLVTLVFLTVVYRDYLDATHHWFSTLAAIGAVMVLALAVAGFVPLWRRDRWVSAGFVLTFLGTYYVVAAYGHWHGLSSFGSRFFVSFTPMFVAGRAVLLEAAARWDARGAGGVARWPSVMIGIVLCGLVAWNIGLMFQWGAHLVPRQGPVDFAAGARNQITIVPDRMARFLARYAASRSQLTSELEREDLKAAAGDRDR